MLTWKSPNRNPPQFDNDGNPHLTNGEKMLGPTEFEV